MIGTLKDQFCALARLGSVLIFRSFGCYGSRAQKLRDTNDRSGGSSVLVEGIVLISTVGVAIVQEGTASITADGIDVKVLAIY